MTLTPIKLTKQEQLGLAIAIAVDAHDGQYDKGGFPYILHPLHLMHKVMYDLQLATIAVLHDVIEDSNGRFTIEKLRDLGFSERVLTALDLLTHKKGVPYEDYIEGIASNFDAMRVKRKDLEHNSDITRLKGITNKDHQRVQKYHKAFMRLSVAKLDFMERK